MDAKLKKLYEGFDAVEYVKTYFVNPEEGMESLVNAVHKLYSSGAVTGTTLLDVGTGPNVGTLVSASAVFSEIYASDISKNARDELQKWVSNSSSLDWSSVFTKISAVEGKSVGDLEARVRKAVKDVLPADILLANPLEPVKKTFDAVQSFFTLEAAVTSEAELKTAVKNLSSLLNKGGVLVLGGIAKATNYTVGSVKYPAFPVTPDMVKDAVTAAGLAEPSLVSKARENPSKPFDGDTYFFVTGVKQ